MIENYEKLPYVSDETAARVLEVARWLSDSPRDQEIFLSGFYCTLQTTVSRRDNGNTFIATGDIPAMWLRDSSAQVHHYLPFAKADEKLQDVIEGLIAEQMDLILLDPYANAFNKDPDGKRWSQDLPTPGPQIWEQKYEIDSLCNPIALTWQYWKATGKTSIFTESMRMAIRTILGLWEREQRHAEESEYYFIRENCPVSDTIPNKGKGNPVAYTGMTWSGFRPSDDACVYNYLVPSNMFAVVVLGYITEFANEVWKDSELAARAEKLAGEIRDGLARYATVEHPDFGQIYAYEVDGLGNHLLMDDANVPSLLSIPYLGFTTMDDPLYQNTRRFVLSSSNPYYAEGIYARGVGSPHTPEGYIWPIALSIQGLTTDSKEERMKLIRTILDTEGGTGAMHESFDPNDPTAYTREWFAWASSIFAELVCETCWMGE